MNTIKNVFSIIIGYFVTIFTFIELKFKKLTKAKYGWKPDIPDHRDFKYSVSFDAAKTLPSSIDMRALCPNIWSQLSIGSCTAHAVGAHFQFLQMKEKITSFMPSRLFIYYNERVLEGTVKSDSGATIRNSVKTVVTSGVCPETLWPYCEAKYKTKPVAKCYTAAAPHKAVKYLSISRNLNQMKQCLVDGYPFIFGFSVYDSFESDEVAKTGIVPMPSQTEKLLGGHAVMAVGYDDSKKCFIVRNSWGEDWGDKGYFYLPYDYFTDSNLSADFWTIRLVS